MVPAAVHTHIVPAVQAIVPAVQSTIDRIVAQRKSEAPKKAAVTSTVANTVKEDVIADDGVVDAMLLLANLLERVTNLERFPVPLCPDAIIQVASRTRFVDSRVILSDR
jgi:hypothetical protein